MLTMALQGELMTLEDHSTYTLLLDSITEKMLNEP